MTEHPDPARLRQWLEGQLDEEESRTIEAHVEMCRDVCQPLLDAMSGFEDDLRPTVGNDEVLPGEVISGPPGYELLAELGRGGMGVIFKARQTKLNRLVALKMILAGKLASSADVQRFRAEAEAAAELDHPNIVPIYETGEYQGQQYFSMKLVEGERLAARLPNLRKDLRQAVPILVKVARAVHFAHQHRILHRDLKPGNVLLDKQGEPYVTDFGLAKRVESDTALTQTGAIVGTPSYMAPEQARGERQLTTATDVYALGAILYELLTGRPPFKADTPLGTVRLVTDCDPVAPRVCNSKADRDLSVVALKCLEKDPAKRYGSAEAVAEELERWLSGVPIQARPAGNMERAWRWCRRYPIVAALSFLVIALLAAGTGVFLDGYFKVRAAKTVSDRKAEEARKGFGLAYRSMNQTVFQIAQDPLLKERGFHELRKQLLEPAVKFYSELVELRSDDLQLEAERGLACGMLAEVRTMLGETEQAATNCREKAAVFAALLEVQPDEPRYRLELASANRSLGERLGELGRHDEAAAAFARADELVSPLLERYPDEAQYYGALIALLNNQGAAANSSSRYEDSRQLFQRALNVQLERDRRFPSTPGNKRRLGEIQMNLGEAYLSLKRYAEALVHLEAGRDLVQKAVEEEPTNPEHLMSLVGGLESLGAVYAKRNRRADQERAWRRSLQLARQLNDQFRGLPSCRVRLARSCHYLAAWLLAPAQSQEARLLLQEATVLLESVVAEFPKIPAYKWDLGVHYVSRGSACSGKDDESALCWADKAIRVLSEGIRDDPRNPEPRRTLAEAHLLRTVSLLGLGRLDEAQRASQRVLALNSDLTRFPLLAFRLQLLPIAVQQQLGPALVLVGKGKVVEGAEAANRLVETRLLGSLRALAATNVLTGVSAVTVARELAGREGAVGDTIYDAACVLARCSRSTAKTNPEMAAAYAARAVLLLTRARDEGYFATPRGWKQLQTDDDMTPLLQRKDFQELRASVPSPGVSGRR